MTRREHLKIAALATVLAGVSVSPSHATVEIADHGKSATPDWKRTALIFIEFQNEWLSLDAPLNRLMEDRDQFESAVANAGRIIVEARRQGIRVVHAGLSLANDQTYALFGGGDGKSGLKGAIPRAGTWRDPNRVTYREPFEPKPGEFVVAGRSGASVITNSNLDAYLRNNGIDHICLLGFALHVCVESTMRQAHDLGYEVTIVSDAAPAFTAGQRAHVLDHVVHHFGRQMTSDAIIESFNRREPA